MNAQLIELGPNLIARLDAVDPTLDQITASCLNLDKTFKLEWRKQIMHFFNEERDGIGCFLIRGGESRGV